MKFGDELLLHMTVRYGTERFDRGGGELRMPYSVCRRSLLKEDDAGGVKRISQIQRRRKE